MPTTNALIDKTNGLAAATLANQTGISKPVSKFMSSLFIQWLSVSGRYNFINLARYGKYSEQSLRNGFERGFNFFNFMLSLIQSKSACERILAFDPSYISKSGKQTFGIGRYWSGVAQQTKHGLELCCLAAVDVVRHTAFHLVAKQTPGAAQLATMKMNHVSFYASIIKEHIAQLLLISKYLVVDAYFMKKDFIEPMVKLDLQVITKMRTDANMRYAFNGKQNTGRGRKIKYGKKVDFKKIDKRIWKKFDTNDTIECYYATLWCVTLKCMVQNIYVLDTKTKRYEILLCTDLELEPKKIVQYYRLRFQIEFLIRDAKQHAGLEHCQARSKNKLDFHFNMALTTVSLVKIACQKTIGQEQNQPFSMLSVKRLFHNDFIVQFIFSNLAVDQSCKKIKQLYHRCLNIGSLAA